MTRPPARIDRRPLKDRDIAMMIRDQHLGVDDVHVITGWDYRRIAVALAGWQGLEPWQRVALSRASERRAA